MTRRIKKFVVKKVPLYWLFLCWCLAFNVLFDKYSILEVGQTARS